MPSPPATQMRTFHLDAPQGVAIAGYSLEPRTPIYRSKPLVAEERVADTDRADSLMGVRFTRVAPITG